MSATTPQEDRGPSRFYREPSPPRVGVRLSQERRAEYVEDIMTVGAHFEPMLNAMLDSYERAILEANGLTVP
jgi:hypothetical protein